jgi:hypothetical protein
MTRTIDEIMARVDRQGFRQALEKQQAELRGRLEALAASYTIEAANPYLKGETKAAALKPLESQIIALDWGITEIASRLEEADEALMNRAARRRVQKNGVKEGTPA